MNKDLLLLIVSLFLQFRAEICGEDN